MIKKEEGKEPQKYLGIKKEERDEWTGYKWVRRTAYIFCPADTVEDQKECKHYRAATDQEIKSSCHPAEPGSCFFSECGCSDTCSFQ